MARRGGPLHDIARLAGGVLAERIDSGSARAELFGAPIDELSPRQRPRRVVVIEDANWADVVAGRSIATNGTVDLTGGSIVPLFAASPAPFSDGFRRRVQVGTRNLTGRVPIAKLIHHGWTAAWGGRRPQ